MFEFIDHNSQFVPILPKELAEPLIILIAKIKGFNFGSMFLPIFLF